MRRCGGAAGGGWAESGPIHAGAGRYEPTAAAAANLRRNVAGIDRAEDELRR